ncbi:MAG: efflux transporter outer membrane subunit [Candidatus Accumulibacter sp.]|jgi:multidrug efflux system outer membrane protein|nr:efflux transporter outer membrane subunit [Accumulibacter sp.]
MKRIDFPRRGFCRPALFSLLAFLTACAVGPDYERPAADLPATFTAVPGKTPAWTASETHLLKEWWRLFGDDDLNELVAKARLHNFDLRAAVARVDEAEALAREAGAAYFPRIDLGASSSRSEVSRIGAIPVPAPNSRMRDSRQAALGVSYEIDLWGRIRRMNEAATADFLATAYAKDTIELSVSAYVVSAYVALRAADANLSFTQSTLESRKQVLDIVRSRVDAGSASTLELYQAEGVLEAARAQLAGLRHQRALAESQLALLTGQVGLTIKPDDLLRLPIPPVPPPGLPSELIESRPDVRLAEESLIAANARIGVAKAALFPSVSLTGNMGSESAALVKLFSAPAEVWSISAALAMPIFDAGRNFARIDQATARQRQELANYLKSVQTAFKEVNDALVGLRENSEGDRAQAARAEAATKTLELAQRRYEAGYSPFLEVLDAQRGANDARLAFIDLRQARLNSVVDLFKAIGGGWSDPFANAAGAEASDTDAEGEK